MRRYRIQTRRRRGFAQRVTEPTGDSEQQPHTAEQRPRCVREVPDRVEHYRRDRQRRRQRQHESPRPIPVRAQPEPGHDESPGEIAEQHQRSGCRQRREARCGQRRQQRWQQPFVSPQLGDREGGQRFSQEGRGEPCVGRIIPAARQRTNATTVRTTATRRLRRIVSSRRVITPNGKC